MARERRAPLLADMLTPDDLRPRSAQRSRRLSRLVSSLVGTLGLLGAACRAPGLVVYQSDFGLADGAVSAMKGVAHGVDDSLVLEDLTHEIRPFDVWQGAYRLYQTAPYWPRRTVFVSVVDPGVGTSRRSIVARSRAGRLFVTPDNGTLTLIARTQGIEAVRWIDESDLRLPGSHASNTFHGRDVYSYVGALLASGRLRFEDVGPALDPGELVTLPYRPAARIEREDGSWIEGTIPVLDPNFGNVWTNVGIELLNGVEYGSELVVRIQHEGLVVLETTLPYLETFGKVAKGEPLAYRNSLGNLAFARNQGDFAGSYGIGSGTDWVVEVKRAGATSR